MIYEDKNKKNLYPTQVIIFLLYTRKILAWLKEIPV